MTIAHPLVDRLRELEAHRANGCLKAVDDDETVTFRLSEGRIASVRSSDEGERLSRLLSSQKIVRPWKVRGLRKKARRNKRHLAHVVVERGHVRQSVMLRILVDRAVRLFRRCIEKDFEVGEFKLGGDDPQINLGLPATALMLSVARDRMRLLKARDEDLVSLRRRDFDFIPWSGEEAALLAWLAGGPRSIRFLGERSGVERSRLRPVLGTLRQIGYVGLNDEVARFGGASRESGPKWFHPKVPTGFRNDKLELLKDQHSFVSEQFKSLKIKLASGQQETAPQVIGVSSPFMGDGKSLVASNLSLTFSHDPGRKVILLDCDLRKPTALDYLGMLPGAGLTHYLEGEGIDYRSYIRRYGKLYVMPAGKAADNPVELLSLEKMRELIRSLRREFDTVILDCPPFEPISDTRILMRMADGMVLVVRSGRTPFGCAERTVKAVEREKVLGIVLNEVKPILFNTYYNYGYYYYGEKGGYPYSSSGKNRK